MWKYKIKWREDGIMCGWGDYLNPADPFTHEMLRRGGSDMEKAAYLHAFTPTVGRPAFEDCQIQVVAVIVER